MGYARRMLDLRVPPKDEARPVLPPWAASQAAAEAAASIERLRASGVAVIGDLDNLRRVPAAAEAEPITQVPVDLAAEALAGVITAAQRRIRKAEKRAQRLTRAASGRPRTWRRSRPGSSRRLCVRESGPGSPGVPEHPGTSTALPHDPSARQTRDAMQIQRDARPHREAGSMSSPAPPRFALVSAVYNVARYLPDFIASLEAETHGLDDVEIIMVDDGSTDDSAEVLAAWAARRPDIVRVIRQANAGQGAARNAGIAAARGEWISFPDPDDALAPDYLAVVATFLDTHPDADLVACHRLMWDETTAAIEDRHPLRSLYAGDSFVDLSEAPDRFHGHSPTSFFRLDRIQELELRFDPRIRPNFEDGHFNACYLLEHERPRVGFLGSARYHYRLRTDGTSTLQTSAPHPGRYTLVPELGYLDVIRRAIARHGVVPGWLASCLLYDMHWYFAAPDPSGPGGAPRVRRPGRALPRADGGDLGSFRRGGCAAVRATHGPAAAEVGAGARLPRRAVARGLRAAQQPGRPPGARARLVLLHRGAAGGDLVGERPPDHSSAREGPRLPLLRSGPAA